MARGKPGIKPSIRLFIYEEAVKHRSTPRIVLAAELEKSITEDLGEKAPARETIEKLISAAWNVAEGPLDEPFTLGSVLKWDIAAEAIPVLLQIQDQEKLLRQQLTIRQARWAAKLYPLVHAHYHEKNAVREALLLFFTAESYALREKGGEFAGVVGLDTSYLDRYNWGHNTPIGTLRLGFKNSRISTAIIEERQRRLDAEAKAKARKELKNGGKS
jgi:hypothetical protein